jgi:branched-chain amino acid transport system permease protein
MIILGGLGSVGGAVVGATFVSALPLVLDEYSESIPGLSEPGSGISYAEAAKYAYGAAVIAVVMFWPTGLAGAVRSLAGKRRRNRRPPPALT